jgi:hypothetical protein
LTSDSLPEVGEADPEDRLGAGEAAPWERPTTEEEDKKRPGLHSTSNWREVSTFVCKHGGLIWELLRIKTIR